MNQKERGWQEFTWLCIFKKALTCCLDNTDIYFKLTLKAPEAYPPVCF